MKEIVVISSKFIVINSRTNEPLDTREKPFVTVVKDVNLFMSDEENILETYKVKFGTQFKLVKLIIDEEKNTGYDAMTKETYHMKTYFGHSHWINDKTECRYEILDEVFTDTHYLYHWVMAFNEETYQYVVEKITEQLKTDIPDTTYVRVEEKPDNNRRRQIRFVPTEKSGG